MNAGKSLVFFKKEAEELKEEEKSVSADLGKDNQVGSTDAAEETVSVKTDEKKPAEAESSGDKPEKTAAETSAADKATELAYRAGRPTGTGIAAGTGLGALMAAVGALHRANTPESQHTVLSNPLLLGALGLAGGYAGGNLFDSMPESAPEKKMNWASVILPGIVGKAGLYMLGSRIKKEDTMRTIAGLKRKIAPLAAKATTGGKPNWTRLTADELKEYTDARKRLARILTNNGMDEAVKALKLEKPKFALTGKVLDKAFGPLMALNPFKKTITGNKKGIKLLGDQLNRALRLTGSGRKAWNSTKVLPARLAAIAALAGTGVAGVNAVRGMTSKNDD